MLADAVDEMHAERWFWQSAMGYADDLPVHGGRLNQAWVDRRVNWA